MTWGLWARPRHRLLVQGPIIDFGKRNASEFACERLDGNGFGLIILLGTRAMGIDVLDAVFGTHVW